MLRVFEETDGKPRGGTSSLTLFHDRLEPGEKSESHEFTQVSVKRTHSGF